MSNPFSTPQAKPGHGLIHLALLPPGTPRLKTASYQYPLKLVSPAPVKTQGEHGHVIYLVYLLTYGGGLVAGDTVNLRVTLEPTTRLTLLTQGTTKIFKTPSRNLISKQQMTVDLTPGSGLCYLPDPIQPFAKSSFEQHQTYKIACPDPTDESPASQLGSLCALDWISSGRPANGEHWSFYRCGSRNEIYLALPNRKCRLLLRDNILLDDHGMENSIAARMNDQAVFGTLIIYGPLFETLGQFFMDEFKALPRIGGRKWDSRGSESGSEEEVDPLVAWRAARQRQETADSLLWSAASLRGCVVVKFGARGVEGGRRWLAAMLQQEGTVVREFGERALLCLR
jgi:urease accessory protein